MDWQRGEYTISDDRARLDFGVIHRFISGESYWGQGRPEEVVRRSVENSVPFGVYRGEEQVGFGSRDRHRRPPVPGDERKIHLVNLDVRNLHGRE